RGLVGHVPALPEDVVDDVVRGADLLEEEQVRGAVGEPRVHALADGGADPVDVDGGNSQHPAILTSGGDMAETGGTRSRGSRRPVLRAAHAQGVGAVAVPVTHVHLVALAAEGED